MTVARSIPKTLAPIVEQLELDGDLIVTVDRISGVLRDLAREDDARRVAYDLQRAGWLGTLRTRGAWEFYPGARGGAYASGDRFVEFRAQKELDRSWPGVLAMESAASLLGYAQRIPEHEVISLPVNVPLPKAFAGEWRAVSFVMPSEGLTIIDDLDTWNLGGLITGIAARPAAYRDVPGLAQWLPDAAFDVDVTTLCTLLQGQPASATQRAAYILGSGGNIEGRDIVLHEFPPQSVAWFGQRRPGGRFDPATQVNDTALHQYLSVGVGA